MKIIGYIKSPMKNSRRSRLKWNTKRAFDFLEDRIALSGVMIAVNSLSDDLSPPGVTTLRQAITLANSDPGSTITFDPTLFASGPGAIALKGALPEIAQTTTISGPGAGQLSVVGGGTTFYRIFKVDAGATAKLSDFTIDGGNSAGGGSGIENHGKLSIVACTFVTNYGRGGAITSDGSVEIANSLFTRNANAIENDGGTLNIVNTNFTINHGGAVTNLNGMASISDSSFMNNTNSDIGLDGTVFNSGVLTVTRSTFSNNGSARGGALYNSYNLNGPGRMIVTDSVISENQSGVDGVIYNEANLFISRTTVSHNYSDNIGGIGNTTTGVATLIDCTLSGNLSRVYGAIGNQGVLSVTNSTLYGNEGVYAGAIGNTGTLTLTNATVTANRSGDLDSGSINQIDGTTLLFNSIIFGNVVGRSPSAEPGDIVGTVDSASDYNLVGNGGGLIDDASHHNLIGVVDAKLGTLANHGGPTFTVNLLSQSPAINGGSIALGIDASGMPLLTDQRGEGYARLVGQSVDIGAYEASPAGTELSISPASISYGGTGKLTATLTTGGRPLSQRVVQFQFRGSELGSATTDTNGVATFNISPTSLHPGTYSDLTASFAGDKDDTASSTNPTALTVVPAPLTITAVDQVKVYGAPVTGLLSTVTYVGFVLGQGPDALNGTLSLTTDVTASSHVGIYPIMPLGLTSIDYAITFVAGQFSVTPAPLFIVANDVTAIHGSPLPSLTANYAGFVASDTPASLTSPAQLFTPATPKSLDGGYPIYVGAATSPDYQITFVGGTLKLVASPTSPPLYQAREAVIFSLYRDILGRVAEPRGLAFWRRVLARTAINPVAGSIYQSPERQELVSKNLAPQISLETAIANARRAGHQSLKNSSTRKASHSKLPKAGRMS